VISVFRLFKSAADLWSDHQAPRLGAAVAFYAIFSITPLVLMTVMVAGMFVDAGFARREFLDQLEGLLGSGAAESVETMIDAAAKASAKGPWAGITSAVVLFVGASGVFVELRYALDAIHGTKRGRDGFVSWFVRGRLWSLALVLAVGFLLLVSLIASAVISAMGGWLTAIFPVLGFVAIALNLLLSLAILTALFGMLMRWLPSKREACWKWARSCSGCTWGAPPSPTPTAPPAGWSCSSCGSTTPCRCSCSGRRSTRCARRQRGSCALAGSGL
jgi:membrane protein